MPVLRIIEEAVATGAAIAALILPVTLAAAVTARSELGVGATVVAPCSASTDPHSSAFAPSCIGGTYPSITSERRVVSLDMPGSQTATVGKKRETTASAAPAAVTFVTISY
jgi:hypothetical protein